MNSTIPQFHEIRLTLSEIDSSFREFIGGPDVVDIGETVRVMLADYFNGEIITEVPGRSTYTYRDRTIVFPDGKGCTMDDNNLIAAIEVYGEIFWSLTDLITHKVLRVNSTYEHRPNDCFYKFFADTRTLVVYTPVLQGVDYPTTLGTMDGRAVMTACIDTLPLHLRNQT